MNRPSIPPDILQKYLNGTATSAEKDKVELWYASLRGQSDYLSTLSDTERQKLQAETYQTIRTQLFDVSPLPMRSTRHWFDKPWAVLSVLAAAVVLIVWIGSQLNDGTYQPSFQAKKQLTIAPKLVHFVNQQPRIVQQRLPDGTLVWLHPQAEIQYPTTFADERRDVIFSGEAFFDVFKDSRRPFRIQSGSMQIQVLGTSFNVQATPKQAFFEVAVVTGKVMVSSLKTTSPTEPVILQPKEEVFYDVATTQLTRHQRTTQVRRELYEPISIAFNDVSVASVLQQLEARFNVRIRIANPALGNCHLTADFTEQSLPVILEMLCTSLDATYSMAGEAIMLYGDGCP